MSQDNAASKVNMSFMSRLQGHSKTDIGNQKPQGFLGILSNVQPGMATESHSQK